MSDVGEREGRKSAIKYNGPYLGQYSLQVKKLHKLITIQFRVINLNTRFKLRQIPHDPDFLQSNDLPRFVAKGKIHCKKFEIPEIARDQENIIIILAAFYNM